MKYKIIVETEIKKELIIEAGSKNEAAKNIIIMCKNELKSRGYDFIALPVVTTATQIKEEISNKSVGSPAKEDKGAEKEAPSFSPVIIEGETKQLTLGS